MDSITFNIPLWMTAEEVAKTFTTYFIAHKTIRNQNQDYNLGPYKKESGHNHWQLDASNEFWLHVDGQEATIRCRYPTRQISIIEAAVILFKARVYET